MKKYILMALVGLMTVVPASAQSYRNSRYYNRNTGRLDYSHRNHSRYGNYTSAPFYVGFRVGPSFSSISSDDNYMDGNSSKTGLNVGVAAGFGVSPYVPLFFETGLYYTEKGGKGRDTKYTLDYLEFPLVLKYIHNFDRSLSIQPFFGGYVSAGIGGKTKYIEQPRPFNSFGDGPFKRFDGGLRMGVGVQFDLLYADITYDLGLANIVQDDFDDTKNSAVMLNIGVNF